PFRCVSARTASSPISPRREAMGSTRSWCASRGSGWISTIPPILSRSSECRRRRRPGRSPFLKGRASRPAFWRRASARLCGWTGYYGRPGPIVMLGGLMPSSMAGAFEMCESRRRQEGGADRSILIANPRDRGAEDIADAEHRPTRQGLAWLPDKSHEEIELGRREIDPPPRRTDKVSRRLVEGPSCEQGKPVDRLDGLRAADGGLAAPGGFVNCRQLLAGVFQNMNLHHVPPLITAASRIVLVK